MYRDYTVAALSLLTAVCAQAQSGSFTPLSDLMGAAYIYDMSDDATAFVGSHGFLGGIWTQENGWVDLGDLPGGVESSLGLSISADGSVVVGFSGGEIDGEGMSLPFRWTAESGIVGLPVPEDTDTTWDQLVSADGQAATWRVTFHAFNTERTYVWDGAQSFELPAVPGLSPNMAPGGISADGSVVVGTETGRAFRWTAATGSVALEQAPGVKSSHALGCSYDGQTVVGSALSDGEFKARPFVWTAQDGMSVLQTSFGHAEAVSGDGLTVGGSIDDGDDVFVWRQASGAFHLRETLLQAGVEEAQGWTLTDVIAVTEDGKTLLGQGRDPDGHFGEWLATLPEPCPFDLNADYRLDLFDFLAFVNLFNTSDPAADCDASGVLDLFDFLCFVDGFNAGC